MNGDIKTLQAVALHYEQGDEKAPKVVATGSGDIAEQILALAKQAGVDIVEDPDLMEVLGRIPVGSAIPEELFEVIAEILVFLYRLNGRYESEKVAEKSLYRE